MLMKLLKPIKLFIDSKIKNYNVLTLDFDINLNLKTDFNQENK